MLFIVRGEAAREGGRCGAPLPIVEEPRLLPVREIVVLDDPGGVRHHRDRRARGQADDGRGVPVPRAARGC